MSTKPGARLGTFKRPNGTAITFTAWRKGRVLIQYERYEPGYPFPTSVETLADVEREDLATFPQWLKQFLLHVENRESVDKDHRIRKEEPGYANIRLSSYATGMLFITVWQRNSPRNPDIFTLTATEVRELIQLLENITKDENAMVNEKIYIDDGAIELTADWFDPHAHLDIIVGKIGSGANSIICLLLNASDLAQILNELERMDTHPHTHPEAYAKLDYAGLWVRPSKKHATRWYEIEAEVLGDESTINQKTTIHHTDYKRFKNALSQALDTIEANK